MLITWYIIISEIDFILSFHFSIITVAVNNDIIIVTLGNKLDNKIFILIVDNRQANLTLTSVCDRSLVRDFKCCALVNVEDC